MGERQPASDAAVIADGRNTFMNLCAPCHRIDGGGLVGSNLTDDYWIHGSEFVDSLKVIWNGVPEKGMVSWKGVLNPEQIHAVASYIYTLRGTNPDNPKPPKLRVPPRLPRISTNNHLCPRDLPSSPATVPADAASAGPMASVIGRIFGITSPPPTRMDAANGCILNSRPAVTPAPAPGWVICWSW
jgi:cytochrome c553